MLRRLARAPGARRATCSHRAASLSTASSPAQADARSFELGDSVDRWRAWAPPQPSPSELLRGARRVLQNDAPYWLHSAARTAFYATHAVAGLAISGRLGEHPLTSERGAKAASSVFRLFAEAFVTFEQDHKNIVDGVYSRPWDADFRHRQFSPSRVLDRGLRFLAEASSTLRRRDAGQTDDVWLKSNLYPKYYADEHNGSTWHYQTDGWMSPASAAVYNTSTETLFIGRQDAMQRVCGLSLLAPALRAAPVDENDPFRGPSVLDVGAGTGRFAAFVRDTFPSASVTLLDLSPFYLAEAREEHAHWEELRGGATQGSASFVQAAAERMPFPDASFDAVTCVYLLHELPPDVRVAAAAEMARVLRPGGTLVVVDSVQLGDRPGIDNSIGKFGDFNEPHYRTYIETDLGALFRAGGLVPWRKELASSSKGLAFKKPEAGAAVPAGTAPAAAAHAL